MCTPKVNSIKNGKKGDKNITKPVSIERLPLLIPTKSSKEAKEISKYFKVLNLPQAKNSLEKLYAWASKSGNNTVEVLKIKNTFSSLKTNKIENIQKIINGNSKPKPCINMTTKGPSRKQVIVLINSDNIKKFMKESSSYISNLNRALKNNKSEVMVDFVQSDSVGITIITNKVASALDLQSIKNYVKNANCIDLEEVEVLHLPQSKFYLKIIGISYL